MLTLTLASHIISTLHLQASSVNAMGVSLWLLPLLLAWLVFILYRRKRQSVEPPYVQPKVPFIGHALGLLKAWFEYATNIKQEPFSFYVESNSMSASKSLKVIKFKFSS